MGAQFRGHSDLPLSYSKPCTGRTGFAADTASAPNLQGLWFAQALAVQSLDRCGAGQGAGVAGLPLTLG